LWGDGGSIETHSTRRPTRRLQTATTKRLFLI